MIASRSLALFSLVFMSLLISQTAAAETICRVEQRAGSTVTVCYTPAEWAQIEEARRREARDRRAAGSLRQLEASRAAMREREAEAAREADAQE